jgi:hypothetical protein
VEITTATEEYVVDVEKISCKMETNSIVVMNGKEITSNTEKPLPPL